MRLFFASYFIVCVLNCADQCTTCDTFTNKCSACKKDYFLQDNNCYVCILPCQVCSSFTDCTQCAHGYHLVNKKCVNCERDCEVCDSALGCVDCYPGFYLSNNTCVKCDASCETCTAANVCQKCTVGYYLKNQQCVSCSECAYEKYCIGNYVCPSSTFVASSLGSSVNDITSRILIIVISVVSGIALMFIVYLIVVNYKAR